MSQKLKKERLREAREARMLTCEQLAEKAGVSRQLITRYESGSVTPRAETILALSVALKVTPNFFYRNTPEPEPAPAFLRSLRSKTSARNRAALEHQVLWVRDLINLAEDVVLLPKVDMPDFQPPLDPRKIEPGEIEQAAQALRRHWGFKDGAIWEIIRLVESKGCICVSDLVDCDAIDAFSQWTKRRRPIIVLNRQTSAARRRVDVAHELGHLALHKNVDRRFIEISPEGLKLVEEQAFRFAGAFLMPEAAFRASLPIVTLDSLLIAKPHWRVSVGAMLHRATDLGMVTDQKAKKLWMNLTRRGWRREEPFEELIPLESPTLLGKALRTVYITAPETFRDICESLCLYPTDLERYAGLDAGALQLGPAADFSLSVKGPHDINGEAIN